MMTNKHTKWLLVTLTVGLTGYFLYKKSKKMRAYSTSVFGENYNAGALTTSTGNLGQAIPEPNWDNPFDMNYERDVKQWVFPQTLQSLETTQAQEMAQILWEAKGNHFWEDDDEIAVSNIFQKRLRDKLQVSVLSSIFWQQYQQDMWVFLKGFLSADEMEAYVNQPVRSLSNYTKNNAS